MPRANFETGMKVCPKCKRELSINEFHKNKSKTDGLASHCRDCYKLRREKRKKSGLCTQCSNPAVDGKTRCESCLEVSTNCSKLLQKKRKGSGLCTGCGNPVIDDKIRCGDCTEKHNKGSMKRFEKRKKEGKCVKCGQPPIEGRNLCITCTLKQAAYDNLGDSTRYKELEDMFTGYCAYTDIPIVIGESASIDHFWPKVTHPHLATDIDNLRWVHISINQSKQGQDPIKFLKTLQEQVWFDDPEWFEERFGEMI